MGGTIKKHANQGDNVKVISMTDGLSSRSKANKSDIIKRVNASKKSSEVLEFEWLNNYNFADNSMDKYPLLEIVKCIEKDKNTFNPDLVYTHSKSELNIDHYILSKAVLTAFRPQINQSCKFVYSKLYLLLIMLMMLSLVPFRLIYL